MDEETKKEVERWKQDKERGAMVDFNKLTNETKNL